MRNNDNYDDSNNNNDNNNVGGGDDVGVGDDGDIMTVSLGQVRGTTGHLSQVQ